jgi:hypothetical protein
VKELQAPIDHPPNPRDPVRPPQPGRQPADLAMPKARPPPRATPTSSPLAQEGAQRRAELTALRSRRIVAEVGRAAGGPSREMKTTGRIR